MIITISGTVGTGKSTAARELARTLTSAGLQVSVLQFRSLPCFRGLQGPLRRRPAQGHHGGPVIPSPQARRAGYRRTRLTPFVTIVYAARIAAFRLYSMRWRPDRAIILDRYFYDLLPHYRVDGRVARLCFLFLHGLIPRPSVAILLQASAENLAARRPEYAPEYLSAACEAYRALLSDFPELVAVRTDDDDGTARAHVETLIRDRLKLHSQASGAS